MTTVSLPAELQRFVEQEIAAGKYETTAEVLCEALRLLQERERRLNELRREIDIGLEQIANDELIDLNDADEQNAFFEQVKLRGAQRLRRTNGGE